MSSNSIIDLIPTSPVHDENSNQSIEIPDPPGISSSENSSSSDSDSDDDLTFDWLDEQMRTGVDLRPLLSRILPGLPTDVSQSTIYEILMDLFLPIRQRKVLEEYKTLDDAVELIRTRKNILILTGAGISVSCGSTLIFYLYKLIFYFF
jgi:hypothetical protein